MLEKAISGEGVHLRTYCGASKKIPKKAFKEMSQNLEIITKLSKELPGGSHYWWCQVLLTPGTAELMFFRSWALWKSP